MSRSSPWSRVRNLGTGSRLQASRAGGPTRPACLGGCGLGKRVRRAGNAGFAHFVLSPVLTPAAPKNLELGNEEHFLAVEVGAGHGPFEFGLGLDHHQARLGSVEQQSDELCATHLALDLFRRSHGRRILPQDRKNSHTFYRRHVGPLRIFEPDPAAGTRTQNSGH